MLPGTNHGHGNQNPPRSNSMVIGWFLFSTLIAVYMITYSGIFQVDDEHLLGARAQSLALWGRMDFPQLYGNERLRSLSILPGSNPAVAVEPLQGWLGGGLVRLAILFDFAEMQTALLLSLVVTALTGVVVFRTVQVLGWSPKIGFWCAVAFGVGTMAWPYSKRFFRDPLAMLMVALAFHGWAWLTTTAVRRLRLGVLLLGIGLVGGALSKHTATVAIPAFIFTGIILACCRRRIHIKIRWWMWFFPLLALGLLGWLSAKAVGGALARYTWDYFEYLSNRFRSHTTLDSLWAFLGPFFSPSRSIFLFSPILLLVPIGVVRGWRRYRRYAMPALLYTILLALSQALYYGEEWAGILTWGLRFMLPVLPLMAVLLAPFVEHLYRPCSLELITLWSGLLGVSWLIQVAGTTVAWHIPYQVWISRSLNPYSNHTSWQGRFFSAPIHFQHVFDPQTWDVAWVRILPRSIWAVIIPGIAILIGSISIWMSMQAMRRVQPGDFFPIAGIAMGALSLIVLFFPGLRILRSDPAIRSGGTDFDRAKACVVENLQAGDRVVVDAYGTTLWHYMINFWDQPTPWYSLPYEIPGTMGVETEVGSEPSQAALALFQQVGSTYPRLWYLSSMEAPDAGLLRESTWLNRELTTQRYFRGNQPPYIEVTLITPP